MAGVAGELVFEVVCKAQFALVAAPLVELLDDGRWQPFFAACRYGHHIDKGQVAGFQRGADAGNDGVNVFGRLLVCPAQGKQAGNVRPQAGQEVDVFLGDAALAGVDDPDDGLGAVQLRAGNVFVGTCAVPFVLVLGIARSVDQGQVLPWEIAAADDGRMQQSADVAAVAFDFIVGQAEEFFLAEMDAMSKQVQRMDGVFVAM